MAKSPALTGPKSAASPPARPKCAHTPSSLTSSPCSFPQHNSNLNPQCHGQKVPGRFVPRLLVQIILVAQRSRHSFRPEARPTQTQHIVFSNNCLLPRQPSTWVAEAGALQSFKSLDDVNFIKVDRDGKRTSWGQWEFASASSCIDRVTFPLSGNR